MEGGRITEDVMTRGSRHGCVQTLDSSSAEKEELWTKRSERVLQEANFLTLTLRI